MILEALRRSVSDLRAAAAAANIAVTPETISQGISAASKASISSPARPKTTGSPLFRRTTLLAPARLLDHQRVNLLLRDMRAPQRFPTLRTTA